MKRYLAASLVGVAAAFCVPTDAAEHAVYRPQLDGVETEEVGYRSFSRRTTRNFNQSSRQFRRDVRDFQDDVRDFNRQASRSRGPVYYGGSRYYRPSHQYYAPRSSVRLGNAVIYW